MDYREVMPFHRRSILAAMALATLMPPVRAARAAAPCPRIGFTLVERTANADTRAVKMNGGRIIFVRRQLLTNADDISQFKVSASPDGDPDDVIVSIKFTAAAAKKLADATTDRSGLRLAFVFNDEIVVAVTWEGRFGMPEDGAQLSVRRGMRQAKRLQRALMRCSPNLKS